MSFSCVWYGYCSPNTTWTLSLPSAVWEVGSDLPAASRTDSRSETGHTAFEGSLREISAALASFLCKGQGHGRVKDKNLRYFCFWPSALYCRNHLVQDHLKHTRMLKHVYYRARMKFITRKVKFSFQVNVKFQVKVKLTSRN